MQSSSMVSEKKLWFVNIFGFFNRPRVILLLYKKYRCVHYTRYSCINCVLFFIVYILYTYIVQLRLFLHTHEAVKIFLVLVQMFCLFDSTNHFILIGKSHVTSHPVADLTVERVRWRQVIYANKTYKHVLMT